MKVFRFAKVSAVFFSLTLLAHTACRPASYEFIDDNGRDTGTPNRFAPDQGKPSPTNLPPTARIETIFNGQAVTKVRVGQPVTIRPSSDTADVDDIGKSSCVNPGIVKANYQIDNTSPTVDRDGGCKDLGVPHTFTQTGDIVISMIVTTNENETATAKMTVTVINTNESMTSTDGGFTIRAYPMIGTINQEITFIGNCYTTSRNTIGWNFADSRTGTGSRVTHQYTAIGQKQVEAICQSDAGQRYDAWVTIVITKDPVPGLVNPKPPVNPCPEGQTPAQSPNQLPGQTPTQGNTPVQVQCVKDGTPTQNLPNQQRY